MRGDYQATASSGNPGPRIAAASRVRSSSVCQAESPGLGANMRSPDDGPEPMLSAVSDDSSSASLANLSSDLSTPSLSSPSDRDSSRDPESLDGLEDYGNQPATFQGTLFNIVVESRGFPRNKRFFPNTVISEVLNENVVRTELQRQFDYLEPAETRMLTRTICGPRPFKKIFALLALVDKLSDIGYFIQRNISDDHLPLKKLVPPGSNLFTLGSSASPDEDIKPIPCLARWNPATIRMFEEWQWSTLAPTFQHGAAKDIKHISLPDDVPLPFTADIHSDTEAKIIQGGYSTVFKVTIHPAHHSFHGQQYMCGNTFAVKRLMSRSKAQFDREKEMLVTFSGNSNPHLISLLATYEQYNEYYLIFPWAGGDLQSYWRDINPQPSMTHDTVLWVAEQCLGLSKGLLCIHRHQTVNPNRHQSAFAGQQPMPCNGADAQVWSLFGVHGDIKPQNVLWFTDEYKEKDRGILKISDFGLAEFKTSTTKIYRPSSQVALSASYRPPECEFRYGRIGQSQDIWALGCLFLEMTAWLLGGWQLVLNFQHRRAAGEGFSYYGHAEDTAFFQIESVLKDGKATVTVKPVVTEFIAHLRSLPSCTAYLNSFLDLIQTEMLILKPTTQGERGRIGCMQLVSKFTQMWQKCQDVEFATAPVFQRKSKRNVDTGEPGISSVKRRKSQYSVS